MGAFSLLVSMGLKGQRLRVVKPQNILGQLLDFRIIQKYCLKEDRKWWRMELEKQAQYEGPGILSQAAFCCSWQGNNETLLQTSFPLKVMVENLEDNQKLK